MKKNYLLHISLAILLASVLNLSARDIPIRGGKMYTIDDTTVETFGDDMNFCFAYRFSDGVIHLWHSKGIHTVTEYKCFDMSLDNGKTWKTVKDCFGINTFEGKDGGKYQIDCWVLQKKKVHTITLSKWNDAENKREIITTCDVEMPEVTSFLLHRDIIRLPSGKLLATAYGKKEGHKKNYSFVIESEDEGHTWKYLSTIAHGEDHPCQEGPDEATVFQLRDGRICAFYREDGRGYLKQCFSSDEGKSWTAPETIDLFSGAASPNGRVLADGTIVVVSGRPDLYLLVDFSGTGKKYQKVRLYQGGGSSYASVLEIAPNEILVIYDESYFGGGHSPTDFARIHASRYKLYRDDSMFEGNPDDPLLNEYDDVFHPTSNQKTMDSKKIGIDYKPADKNPDYPSTFNVITIPERPHPVMRLVSRGEKGNEKFPVVNANINLDDTRWAAVGAEVRLNDSAEKMAQFHMAAVVGADSQKAFKGFLAYVRIYTDKIEILEDDGNGMAKSHIIPYDIGTTYFHAFRLEADARSQIAKLLLEGENDPIVTIKMPKATGQPIISFGDGDSSISGECDVSYLAWKVK